METQRRQARAEGGGSGGRVEGRRHQALAALAEALESITADQVSAAVRTYLSADKCAACAISPGPDSTPE